MIEANKYLLLGKDTFADEPVSEDHAGYVQHHVDDLTKIIDEHKATVATIDADRGLNDIGKADRVTAVRTETVTKIAKLDSRCEKVKKDLAEAMKGVPVEAEVIPSKFPLYKEIRQYLFRMTHSQRVERLERAADLGDLDVVAAMKQAPKSFELVDPGLLEDSEKRVIRASAPDAFEKIDTINSVLNTMKNNRDTALRAIGFNPALIVEKAA